LFAFLRVIGLFLRSEAPGLVFSEEKNGGLPPVTSEKPYDPRVLDLPCKQFDAASSNFLEQANLIFWLAGLGVPEFEAQATRHKAHGKLEIQLKLPCALRLWPHSRASLPKPIPELFPGPSSWLDFILS
jgi:hypothetical protein